MTNYPAGRKGEQVLYKGEPVEFSQWPDATMKRGPLSATSVWIMLSEWITRNKDLEPLVRKRASHYVKQAEQFFKGGSESAFDTKPLMYYYSYLNLTKAFLMCRRNMLFGDENQRHGLSNTTFPQRFRGLHQVKATSHGISSTRVNFFNELVRECGFRTISGEISLHDMLFQLPSLHDTYSKACNSTRDIYDVFLEFKWDRKSKDRWIYGQLYFFGLSDSEKKKLRQWCNNNNYFKRIQAEKTRYPADLYLESIAVSKCKGWPWIKLKESLVNKVREVLCTTQSRGGLSYMIRINPKFTSQLAADFAVMFILGSLARYQPENYEKLLKYWIIHEYLCIQPMQFAYLMGSGIIRNEITPP